MIRTTPGILERNGYGWRRQSGGLRIDRAKRLKDLEMERNAAVGYIKPISVTSITVSSGSSWS